MSKTPKRFIKFMEQYPEIGAAYDRMGAALTSAGPLSEREIALVKIGISAGARMEGALKSHVRKAQESGLSKDDIRHAILLSTTTIGFPNMMAALKASDDILEDDE